MIYLRNISRYIVAIVFIFSGFVKGVDPLGTAYRLDDYFIAYGTEWASVLSLFLSIALSTIEFLVGMALLLKLKMKATSWALLVIMSFFTILTLFDAKYEPVSDCGCFGDAIKLTNWETFYKNVVLMVFTLIVFIQRKAFRPHFTVAFQNLLAIIVSIGFVWFSVYNYRHLPMIDFRPWKVGNQMTPDPDQEAEIYLQYRNKQTNEIREYLSPNYPWNDSAWMAEWEFVDQRVVTYGEIVDHGLYVTDDQGFEHTDLILEHEGMLFLGIIYDFEKASRQSLEMFSGLQDDIHQAGLSMVILTGNLPDEMETYIQKYNLTADIFYVDVVTLKTMVRANPGLILMKSGQVHGKWHHRDIPAGKKRNHWLQSLQEIDQE